MTQLGDYPDWQLNQEDINNYIIEVIELGQNTKGYEIFMKDYITIEYGINRRSTSIILKNISGV